MPSNIILFILNVFLSFVTLIESDNWKYPELNEEGGIVEDVKWGGLCETGKQQSPINLRLSNAIQGHYNQLLQLTSSTEEIGKVSLKNNGHTIQMFNFKPNILIRGGPLSTNTYKLEQIHFHWWAEHTIDSQRFPFETHIVFRNIRYPNVTIAAQNRDGLTVIGILYHISFVRNNFLDDIIMKLDTIKSYEKSNQIERFNVDYTMSDIIGSSLYDYLTYNGSLTTPNCGEAVTWIINSMTLPITIEQVNAFKSVEYDLDKNLMNNYRSTQRINDRAVVRVREKVNTASNVRSIYEENNSSCSLYMKRFWSFDLVLFLIALIFT